MKYDAGYVDQLRMILETGDTPMIANILMGLRLERRMPELQGILSEILEGRQQRDMGLKQKSESPVWRFNAIDSTGSTE